MHPCMQMPLPNYQPSSDRPKGTLGLKKLWFNGSSFLSKITTVVPDAALKANQSAAGQQPEQASGEPLLIFDPDAETDETKRCFKKIYVEPFLASKLRPHQRDGVQFMFRCLAGLKRPDLHGCILMDGMGLGKTFQSITTLWTLLTTGKYCTTLLRKMHDGSWRCHPAC